jgi:AcrR family transcriptional regulator
VGISTNKKGKTKKVNSGATLRTAPQQTRGQERVNLILDVSEKLLLMGGYEALTTNAVAAEAKISIGSLYHFFGDKVAILEALIERYNTEYFAVLEPLHQKSVKLEGYLDSLLETLEQFSRGRPALLLAFSHALTASKKFETMEEALSERMSTMMSAYYRQYNPKLSEEKACLIAWLVLTMAEALLLSIGDNKAKAEVRYQETKKLLKTYLELYL